MMNDLFQDVRMIPAMVTPMTSTLDLDLSRAAELVDRLIQGGADALVINGTTGESPTVFYPQKIKLFEAAVQAADGRVPIIANVGDNCTADTVQFARDVSPLGVDAFMCVVPYYNKPPQEGIYQHFRTIADSTELPIILYNIPGRCAINMSADTTLRLAHDCQNIVAVKEASGDVAQITRIINEAPDGFFVYSGDDSATYDLMRLGAQGVISTIGNVLPGRMKQIVDACAHEDWAEASELNRRLLPLMEGLFATANPILVKKALELIGFPVGGVRLPLVDATPEQTRTLQTIMEEVGAFAD